MRPILPYLLISLLATPLWAGGGLTLRVQGHRQQGTAHAGTAWANDAAILAFNPGAAPFVRKTQFITGFSLQQTNTAYLGRNLTPDQTLAETATPMYAYALLRPNPDGPLTLGLAVYSPFGGNTRWGETWQGKAVAQTFSVNSVAFQPTASLRLNSRMGVGLGIIFLPGNLQMQRALPLSSPDRSAGSLTLSGSGNGIGANIGWYYRPSHTVAFGLDIRTPINLRIKEGIATFQVPASLRFLYPQTNFQTTLHLPAQATIGATWYPQDALTLLADVSYTLWTRFDSLVVRYETQTTAIHNIKEARAWKNSLSLRIGGEYRANEDLLIRGGAFFAQSPVPDGYVSPELPDANALGVTGGGSYRLHKHIVVDASYQFAFTGSRTASLNAANFGGTYKTNTVTAGIGIAYLL